MRTFFKVIGYLLLVLVVVVIAAVIVVRVRSGGALQRKFTVQVRPIPIPSDASSIARGAHISKTRGCIDCHGVDLAGGKVIDDGAMGELHGSNLTSGKGSAVLAFKDEDWIRAIRHGVGADGRGLFIMPSAEYSKFSDEDLGSLVAYLKTLSPVDRERPETKYGPISRVLLTLSADKMISANTIDHTWVAPKTVAKGPTIEYGKYLAEGCTGCHRTNFSGGKIDIGPPDWPLAANLTPQGNLSKWSEADFIATIRTAKRPDGTDLNQAMPRGFGGMDEVELKALWAFFRSLPPLAQGTPQ